MSVSISASWREDPSISAGGSPVPGKIACHTHGRNSPSWVAVTATLTGVPEQSAHEKKSRMGLGRVCMWRVRWGLSEARAHSPWEAAQYSPRPFSADTLAHASLALSAPSSIGRPHLDSTGARAVARCTDESVVALLGMALCLGLRTNFRTPLFFEDRSKPSSGQSYLP